MNKFSMYIATEIYFFGREVFLYLLQDQYTDEVLPAIFLFLA